MSALPPRHPIASPPSFRSFWMGGYEGADHRNSAGIALDINAANGHAARCAEDYAAARRLGLRTIRESIGWRASTDARGIPDLHRLRRMARAARRCDLQVIWTIHHYGVPPGIDLFAADTPARFAQFCDAISRTLRDDRDGPTFYQPVNEVSFLTWAVCHSDLMHPYLGGAAERTHELKRNLVRMVLQGCDAIRANEADARFVHTDPLIHVIADSDDDEARECARLAVAGQYEAWDMIAGRRDADLGGASHYLDVVGVNYYHGNQWQVPDQQRLHWHLLDPRRVALDELLAGLYARYARPIVIAETGHVGAGRGAWLDEIGAAALRARDRGVPLEGICLYPLVDRADWEDTTRLHESGLWEAFDAHRPGAGRRRLHEPYASRLRNWQGRVAAPADAPPLAHSPMSGNAMPHPVQTLIVFSHLRWDFVYQRPQHVLSRLATRYRIVFVEEPIPSSPRAALEVTHPCEGVEVLRPHVTGAAPGFHDDHITSLRAGLRAYLDEQGIDDYLLWFYTPMAMPLAAELAPRAIVYDCMDELAAFHHAPRQLLQRENALFKAADVVFTGGRSLYESKLPRHPHVYCFPSSVDAAHFAGTRRTPGTDHPAQADIPHPRLGYFGVIDERIDLPLIAALADARPDRHIVMVGPIVKIDPDSRPQRANIHWLGQRPYAELPDLVHGWDVCLLPFALNESTRYISPTKTLEYLAADRPVVSTPIRDVVDSHADVVSIAGTHADFIAACDAALARTTAERATDRLDRARAVALTSWDATVDAMAELMASAHAGHAAANPTKTNGASREAPVTRDVAILVLGAGPTGLAAALQAGVDSVLVEKNSTVGGWCRSIEDGGFTFDHAGHIMFSKDPDVLALYERLLGDNLHWQDREAWIYSKEVYTRYPFQAALYGLPAPVLKECLVGAIEARFGPLGDAAPLSITGPSRARVEANAREPVAAVLQPIPSAPKTPRNFEEFIHNVWGAGVAKHFAIPYNRKLWAVPLADMETSWLGGRVPMPNLEEMIEGALAPVAKPFGPNARFGYPLRGGFQALMDGFLPLLEGDVELDATVVSVSPSARTVTLADGRRYRYTSLVSTLPLPKLVDAIGTEAPAFVHEAAAGLRHVSVRCVNLGIGRANLTDKHWIYYPEETVFHRVFVQGNTSPHCNPAGGTGLTCEITYGPNKPLPVDGDALIRRCIDECIEVGLFTRDDAVLVSHQVDMPIAYVVYDHTRAARVATIREWLLRSNIVLAGRYSEWEYYNSDHAFVAGRKAAETAARLSALTLDDDHDDLHAVDASAVSEALEEATAARTA